MKSRPLVMMLAALWLGAGLVAQFGIRGHPCGGPVCPASAACAGAGAAAGGVGLCRADEPAGGQFRAGNTSAALAALQGGSGAVVALAGDELWLRQADRLGQTVIHARRAEDTGTVLFDASFFVFHAERGLSVRLQADRADLRPGSWRLSGVKRWRLSDLNPEAQATTLSSPCHCN